MTQKLPVSNDIENIHFPHDSVVKKFFTTDSMKEFLTCFLPEELLNEINVQTLASCDPGFIDAELTSSSADLLFKATCVSDQEAYIYILFEHKSSPESDVALQLLRYITNILCNDEPAFVLPIVFYHGKTLWQAETSFQQSIFPKAPEVLRAWMPEFHYWFFDVRTMGDLDIAITSELQALFLVFKALNTRAPFIYLEKYCDVLLKWIKGTSTNREKLESLLRYLADQTDRISDYKHFENQLTRQGAKMPSVLEQLTKQGLEQGREQGLEQGQKQSREQIASKMLNKGYAPAEIAELTGLELAKIEELTK